MAEIVSGGFCFSWLKMVGSWAVLKFNRNNTTKTCLRAVLLEALHKQ
jgi:hypothetical protein